jgi:succinyl-CoA synthetase beta subunit
LFLYFIVYRRKQYVEMGNLREDTPTKVDTSALGFNYVNLERNVGCRVNGAGLAMAAMDLIKMVGGGSANFMDVVRAADAKRVEEAFRVILKDEGVKKILVKNFDDIVRCDRVVNGIVECYKHMGDATNPLIIVRLQGAKAIIAKEIPDNSRLAVYSTVQFQEAADKVKEVIAKEYIFKSLCL